MKPLFYMGSLIILLMSGCGKFSLTPEVSIYFQDPANISETGFDIGWSVNPSDYTTLTFVLATDPSFNSIIETREFQDRLIKSTRFSTLTGATTYYFRLSLERGPGSLFISQTESVELPFHQDQVIFETPDSALLAGSLSYLESAEHYRPGVIMMHEFGIFVNGWSNSDMLKALVAEGYICLVYSNRGHGQSSYIEDRQELINDPKYLANDLRGAMTYLTGHELVMADSIGLMGGSMGASMAVAGNGYERVLTSVALSPANLHINYMFPGIPPRSVFYLVGENDIVNTGEEVINFPVESNALYKLTNDPRKIMILEGSIAHGTELLEQIGVKDEILLWFQTQLPVIH